MILAKAFIWFVSCSFILYGALFTFWPAAFFEAIFGVLPNSADALVEVRASCGGMSLAIGAVLAFLALKESSLETSLKLIVIAMSVIALTRVFGMLMAGHLSSSVVAYLIFEAVVAGIAALLLAKSQARDASVSVSTQFSK